MNETILHHLLKRKNANSQYAAIQFKEKGRWLTYSWDEYFKLCESIAGALAAKGIQRGDRVAILADTRPEWILTDMAIMGLGAITIPIYANNLDEDVEFILNNSEAKAVFLDGDEQIAKWERIAKKCPTVDFVATFKLEKKSNGKNIFYWSDVLKIGRAQIKSHPGLFIDQIQKSQVHDLATILYTSGTTGRPKGVVLTHEQIISELEDVFSMILVNHEDISLSFLPYSHVLGRVEAWGNIYAGFIMAFAESIDKIRSNIQEIHPTFMISVPRIFEKIYAGILSQVESSPTRRKIFNRALEIGKRVSAAKQAKKPLGLRLSIEFEVAKQLVFNKILQALGGRMRFAVSGGAPLSPDISRFFHGLGLLICEGYGLTETTAGVCFNTPLSYKFDTVGKPIGEVKIKIAEDGEILVSSKKVMKEYYKDPKATEEAFTNGYFKTGDIGHLDEDGFLHITDRKKDLIKTAGGKYVAPQKLENLLKLNPNISNVLIHGDQKKYIVALVTLNQPNIEKYAEKHSIFYANFAGLSQQSKIYQLVKEAVAEANTQLASYESIKKFAILPADFTVESGELTPSLKVKRKVCDQKFQKQINELYEG